MRHQDSWETAAQRRAARLCTFAVEGAQSELDGCIAVQHSQLERPGCEHKCTALYSYSNCQNGKTMTTMSQQISIVLLYLAGASIHSTK